MTVADDSDEVQRQALSLTGLSGILQVHWQPVHHFGSYLEKVCYEKMCELEQKFDVSLI
jgi:hypothetical protein